jgi:hypothetical protein
MRKLIVNLYIYILKSLMIYSALKFEKYVYYK